MSSISTSNLAPDAAQALSDAVRPASVDAEHPRSVWGGFRWALVGNLIFAASQWLIYIVLARVGTPELVGQYALALAIAGPVVFASNLQLRAIQASDASGEYAFADFWCLRLVTAPLALLTISAIAVLGNYTAAATAAIVLIGVAKVIESLSDICLGAIQREDRLDLVGKSLTIKGPLSLLAIGLLVGLTGNVSAGAIALAAGWCWLFYRFDYQNLRRCIAGDGEELTLVPTWNAHELRRLVRLGLPMGLSMGMLSLTIGLPNILLERFLGEREVGIFAALASLTWAGLPFINAMGQTAMPRLGRMVAAADAGGLRRTVLKLASSGIVFGGLGVSVVWCIGSWAVDRIYGVEYAQHVDVLLWLMVAASVLYAVRFLADALTALRCVKILLLVQTISAAIVLGGGLLVVPVAGMLGMAKVLVLAFLARGVILLACFFWRTAVLTVEPTVAAAE